MRTSWGALVPRWSGKSSVSPSGDPPRSSLGRGLSSPARSGSPCAAARRGAPPALPAPAPSVPQARGSPALRLGVLPNLRPSPGQGPPEPASGCRGGWRFSVLPLYLLAYWVPQRGWSSSLLSLLLHCSQFCRTLSEDHRDSSAQPEEPPHCRGLGYSSSASSGYRQQRRNAPDDPEGGSGI